MVNRTYTPRETRWVSEYVRNFFPREFDNGQYVFQAPLGYLADGPTSRLAPRVDAVIMADKSTTLIEGEIEKPMSALGDLIHYRDLFFTTERFKARVLLPVSFIILIPDANSNVELQASKQGVEVSVWKPDWLAEYMIERRGRHRVS